MICVSVDRNVLKDQQESELMIGSILKRRIIHSIATKLSTTDFTTTANAWAGTIGTHLLPDTDITYDLGSATHRFRDLYLSGSSIVLGAQEITSNTTHSTFTNSIAATTVQGTLTTVAQPNITSVGTLSGLTVTATITGSSG